MCLLCVRERERQRSQALYVDVGKHERIELLDVENHANTRCEWEEIQEEIQKEWINHDKRRQKRDTDTLTHGHTDIQAYRHTHIYTHRQTQEDRRANKR